MKRYDSTRFGISKRLLVLLPVLLCLFCAGIGAYAENSDFQQGGEGAVSLDVGKFNSLQEAH